MFSFKKRAKTAELRAHVRRLCDITTAVEHTGDDSKRKKARYNRAIPTLICAWEDERPAADEVVFGLTHDVSEQGVGVILNDRFQAEKVIVGYFLDSNDTTQPLYYLGETRYHAPFGGGFWGLGLELIEYLNRDHHREMEILDQFAESLLPPAQARRERNK